jgi:hypothetical protein
VNGVDENIADQPGGFPTGENTVATLTDRRFLGQPLSSWIPSVVVTALLDGLGMTGLDPDRPLITDIDHPVCTAVDGGYILSFTAVIQFSK